MVNNSEKTVENFKYIQNGKVYNVTYISNKPSNYGLEQLAKTILKIIK